MENREDLRSMLPFLPLLLRSSNLFWPSQAVESLKTLSKGPLLSKVDSGESLFIAISSLRRDSFGALSSTIQQPLAPFAREGYALFFDELISRAEAATWFGEVVPALTSLLLRLPSLLESHYQNADNLINGVKTGLRLLGPQESGIVFLSQELIGALLACALFCLFPVSDRGAKDLPMINFDYLFKNLYDRYSEMQENKIKCMVHYFERICASIPEGFVSFERKVLHLEQVPLCVSYPKADFWSKSAISLCPFEVQSSGLIEDQSNEALEVDFANKYLGGGALQRGCVQEEIRFMINPELIAGMLFLPCMEDNEAIEIVGAERFSNYIGYAASFRFSGDHVDKRSVDTFRRRKTRIIAIDALCGPGMRQFKLKYLLRETNKAFCGFLNPSKCGYYEKLFQDSGNQGCQCKQHDGDANVISKNFQLDEASSTSMDIEMNGESMNQAVRYSDGKGWSPDHEGKIGVATGNWGCGAFGGDPELKTIIQWLAASQALRPSILYYTFGLESLQNLNQVTQWILLHGWTVGDLWNMLVEYSSQRFNKETNIGFFTWLLPSLIRREAEISNLQNTP